MAPLTPLCMIRLFPTSSMPTRSQKFAVVLAFTTTAPSLAAASIRLIRDGSIAATPLFGGLLMLTLGIGGYRRFKNLHS